MADPKTSVEDFFARRHHLMTRARINTYETNRQLAAAARKGCVYLNPVVHMKAFRTILYERFTMFNLAYILLISKFQNICII